MASSNYNAISINEPILATSNLMVFALMQSNDGRSGTVQINLTDEKGTNLLTLSKVSAQLNTAGNTYVQYNTASAVVKKGSYFQVSSPEYGSNNFKLNAYQIAN